MSAAAPFAGTATALAVVAVAELVAHRSPRGRRPRRTRRGGRWPVRLAVLGRRFGMGGATPRLEALIAAAGEPLGLSAADVSAAKAGAATAGVLPAVWVGSALGPRLGVLVGGGLIAAAFRAPDRWLARLARVRAEQVDRELADVLELLRVPIGAGLAPMRALREVGRHRGGLLAAELGRVARSVELGVPQAQALGALRRRCPGEGVAALVNALGRSARHGAPLDPALRALAVQARARRAQALSDAAARAGPKIQLAVALLLVPGTMALVAAAIVAGLTSR